MKKKIFLLFTFFSLVCLPTFTMESDYSREAKMQALISNVGFKILNANRIENRMVFNYKHYNRSINACTKYSDRSIDFYKGLAVRLDSEAEYAAILSHEISHGIDYSDGPFKGFFSPISMAFVTKKYEEKADKRAVDYMVKAGYNPLALIVVMSKTFSQSRYDWGFWVSHPLPSKRMAYIYEYIYTKYPSYLVDNEYKNNIYYQNFLLTSKTNRLKLQEKVEHPSTNNKKTQYL